MNKYLLRFSTLNFLIGSAFIFAANKMPKMDLLSGRGPSTTTNTVHTHSTQESCETPLKNSHANRRRNTQAASYYTKQEINTDAPYIQEDSKYKADNTAKNVRDRNPDTSITPIDQNQSFESDVEITRLIRKEIVSDKSLSTYAKNVKIITINGLVTLRGPVRTASERAQVEGHAEKIVPMNYIVNKLEIAPVGNAR